MPPVSWSRAVMAGQASGSAVSHTVETDLITVSDSKFADKNLCTLYIDQILGTATTVKYGIYVAFDSGASPVWYKLSVEDLTTNKGDLVDIPPYVDANSPAQSTHIRTVFTFSTPACVAIKITGLATGAADSGAYKLTLMARNI